MVCAASEPELGEDLVSFSAIDGRKLTLETLVGGLGGSGLIGDRRNE